MFLGKEIIILWVLREAGKSKTKIGYHEEN
jgi:hypothetical protein